MEAIWLQGIQNLCFRKEAMKNMIWLRILYIRRFHTHDDSIEYLPNNLHWFDCYKYPWETLPENFEPKRLVYLELQRSSLRHLWSDMTKHLPSLRKLNLSFSKRLMQTPDFTWIPNLEYLHLRECTSLEEVHHSLGYSKKLILLNLCYCESLERFTCVSGESLEYLYLHGCGSLETFPKILGTMKPELEIHTAYSGIRELPSSIIQHLAHLTELNLSAMENLVALPCSICELRGLVKLDVSYCSKLESLPENIGDLENLEKLNARHTLISQPPSSIVRLNKLKFLTFTKQQSEVGHEDGVYFVFPQVNKGLLSLEYLDLSYCNVIDGLPEDIGSLFSLKKLYLQGNNFEHLPQSMAQLGALQSLYLLDCTRLTQLPEFPQQLVTIYADWSNDSICDSLFQNISSLQHDISASDSLSLRMFTTGGKNIPSWFHHQGMDRSVSVNLPENWYVADNFLGFAVCCSGSLIETTVHLISYDGMLQITQKLALCNPSKRDTRSTLYFFLVPFAGLWDRSKANGKTPNDYGLIRLCFSGEIEYGLRLLYKDEPKLEVLLQTRESNDERCIRARMSRYDSSEHHDSVTNEAGCSSSKTQIVTFLIFMGTLLLRICCNN